MLFLLTFTGVGGGRQNIASLAQRVTMALTFVVASFRAVWIALCSRPTQSTETIA